MKETTYLSSIISALNKLNGMGSLNEIYEAIEEEGKLNFIYSNPNWKDMLGLQYKDIVARRNLIEEVKIYFVRSTEWVRVIGN